MIEFNGEYYRIIEMDQHETPRLYRNIIDLLSNEPPDEDIEELSRDPSKQFGKYILAETLGEGGAGSVYRAYDTKLRTYVALKILNSVDADSLQRFIREAELIASLKHPNIVPIYEINDIAGKYYISMQYIAGFTLGKLPDKLSEKGFITIFIKICETVHSIHQHNIVHRDIKPENIVVDKSGWPYVFDFGIAKKLGNSLTVNNSNIIGTPNYMSPEQINGKEIDCRADIYSLGATMYSCFSGKSPYDGADPIEILKKVLETSPQRLNSVCEVKVAPEIELIIDKCMEKDPSLRYQTMLELKSDLQNYISGDPISVRAPSFAYLLSKKIRKHRFPILIILLVLLFSV
ncbi:MAG: serine/threonine protein kinase, partial [Planctomycetes bacterium]|nr:serine/threonine protein kinase [Planctomycetota bacterium]